MCCGNKSILDRSRPELPTTASGVARQGNCKNYAAAGLSKNKRRKAREKTAKTVEGETHTLLVGTLNIVTVSKRRRELASIMERRNVDIACCAYRKEWKGSKARNIGGGCKLLYNGADGTGIMVRENLVESVLELKRVSDRLMAMKLKVKGSILNIVIAYAPQVGNSMEEKNDFWQDLDGLIESVSKQELRIVLGADLNGHMDKGNIGENIQVDYVMCRRRDRKEMCDCKVMVNERVAKQHRMVVCKMALMVKKKKVQK